MAVNGEVTSSRVVTRRFHARDMVSVSDARHVLADVGPGGAAVSTDLNVAIVSSDPQYAWDLRRLRHRHDVTVSGITVVLGRHRVFARHAHDRQRAAIDLFREIGSSGPRVAPIHRSEQTIAADKHDPRIVRRKMNRRAPVETIGLADGRCRNNVRWKTSGAATTESLRRRKLSKLRCGVGSWRGCSCRTRARRWRSSAARTLALSTRTRLAARSNTHASSRAQIQTLHCSTLRFRVNDVVVRRINLRVKAVAAGDAIPISVGNSYLQISRLAWTTPRAVVLQSAVDVIRLTHIDADCVELRGRNRVDELPGRALIVTNVQTTVVTNQQVIAVRGIDPDRVVIDVRDACLQRSEGLASVYRLAEVQPADVNRFRVLWIDTNLAVIHRAIVFVADNAPGFSLVV